MKKKLLAIIATIAMIVAIMPSMVFADGSTTDTISTLGVTVTYDGDNSDGSIYEVIPAGTYEEDGEEYSYPASIEVYSDNVEISGNAACDFEIWVYGDSLKINGLNAGDNDVDIYFEYEKGTADKATLNVSGTNNVTSIRADICDDKGTTEGEDAWEDDDYYNAPMDIVGVNKDSSVLNVVRDIYVGDGLTIKNVTLETSQYDEIKYDENDDPVKDENGNYVTEPWYSDISADGAIQIIDSNVTTLGSIYAEGWIENEENEDEGYSVYYDVSISGSTVKANNDIFGKNIKIEKSKIESDSISAVGNLDILDGSNLEIDRHLDASGDITIDGSEVTTIDIFAVYYNEDTIEYDIKIKDSILKAEYIEAKNVEFSGSTQATFIANAMTDTEEGNGEYYIFDPFYVTGTITFALDDEDAFVSSEYGNLGTLEEADVNEYFRAINAGEIVLEDNNVIEEPAEGEIITLAWEDEDGNKGEDQSVGTSSEDGEIKIATEIRIVYKAAESGDNNDPTTPGGDEDGDEDNNDPTIPDGDEDGDEDNNDPTTPGGDEGKDNPSTPSEGGTTPGNTGSGTSGASGGSTTPDSSVNTGDDFSAIPYIAVMVIALAGVAAALFRRKTVK